MIPFSKGLLLVHFSLYGDLEFNFMKLAKSFFKKELFFVFFFSLPRVVVATEKFNVDFLKEISGDAELDPSLYDAMGALSGVYKYELFLSDTYITNADVTFNNSNACIELSHLSSLGATKILLDELYSSVKNNRCLDMHEIDQLGIKIDIDNGENKINFNIPGKFLTEKTLSAKDSRIPDARFASDGITALYLNYDVLENQSSMNAGSRSMSGRFNYGLNGGERLYGWSAHSSASISKNNDDKTITQGSSYLARDIVGLKSTFFFGDVSIENDFFGGNSIRGVQMSSIDALNEKPGGASALITGIANSNAKIELFQGERLVSMRMVPPGPYRLEDMFRGSGQFIVRQTEADGTVTSWPMHVSPAINQLRQDYWRYAFSAGERISDQEAIAALQLSHGLSDRLTLMGGVVYAQPYTGFATGAAVDAGLLGGISFSGAYSRSQEQPGMATDVGMKYDLLYHKTFEYASVSLDSAWYSGDFNQVDVRDDEGAKLAREVSLSISTSLWELGLSLNHSYGYYREGQRDSVLSISSSYGLPAIQGIDTGTLTLNWQENEDREGKRESRVLLGWSRQLFGGAMTAYIASSGDGSQNRNLQFSRSHERLSYSVAAQQQVSDIAEQINYDTSLTYQANRATLRGAVTQFEHGQAMMYGLSGGVVAYSGGILTSNEPVSSNYLIVESDLPGSQVHGNGYRYGNWFGGSVLPRGTPYRELHVDIDTSTVPDNTEVIDNARTVLMKNYTAGHVRFDSKYSRRVVIDVDSQSEIPFGTPVKSESGDVLGWMGSDGQAFLEGVQEGQPIFIRWLGGSCIAPLSFDSTGTRYFEKVLISC